MLVISTRSTKCTPAMTVHHSLAIPESLDELQATFHGTLLRPGDDGYDEARSLWNAMIDRHPGAIARPAGPAGVIAAVEFARETGMQLAVKGAGHNIAGSAMVDDGLVIDLADMDSVQVDPDERIAHVEPGATLADGYDHVSPYVPGMGVHFERGPPARGTEREKRAVEVPEPHGATNG